MSANAFHAHFFVQTHTRSAILVHISMLVYANARPAMQAIIAILRDCLRPLVLVKRAASQVEEQML
jgi:hypothetical protein